MDNFYVHTRKLYYQRVKKQEFCFGDLEGRLGVRGRAVMVDVPEAKGAGVGEGDSGAQLH